MNVEGNMVEFVVCIELAADVHFFDPSGVDRDMRRSAWIDRGGKVSVREGGIHRSGDH